ncbi:hypothetical protein L1987_70342 [Smallanthus sonchifolius]|uniref:Uncharacterized protein n=1 Tax=Smallanthus sonchifolius TaxID=185202 RepID=A0ACB9APW8_9ASTR|nr:hypothetical protein L1987_70342 [Smallanthus sonchifolius]
MQNLIKVCFTLGNRLQRNPRQRSSPLMRKLYITNNLDLLDTIFFASICMHPSSQSSMLGSTGSLRVNVTSVNGAGKSGFDTYWIITDSKVPLCRLISLTLSGRGVARGRKLYFRIENSVCASLDDLGGFLTTRSSRGVSGPVAGLVDGVSLV